MENLLNKIYKDKEFISIINDIISHPKVQKLKEYRQHCNTTRFEHCLFVSYYSYLICKKMNLDYKSSARAGMLHDLFLYDWRKRQNGRKGLHAYTHPKEALKNASNLFNLNNKEKDIILKHMWPVTLPFPKYKESYIITFVDKHCALSESIFALKNFCFRKNLFRYAYVFLSLLIFRF